MKLAGRYKGTRRKHAPPVLIVIECPGCGWKSQPAKVEESESEYVLHLNNVHHGLLDCAFCPESLSPGIRFLPCFATLAAHVKHFHPEIAPEEEGAIPPHAFR